MQVTQEALDPCQVALTIEVEQDKVVHAVDQAYREYAKYLNVPGFRRGKAPLSFVKQRVSESDVRQRTAELLIEKAYGEAIKEQSIEPYAAPKLELLQLELAGKPFIFKAVVPLPPVVTPGAYTNLSVDKAIFTVTDEDVTKQLEALRERSAEFPEVERESKLGDLLVTSIQATVEGEGTAGEPRTTVIEIGGDNIPGFDDEIIGLKTGAEKTFTLTYPEDFKVNELASKVVTFRIEVEAVRERALPEVNDEFATRISAGKTNTVDELLVELKSDMIKELERSAIRDAQYKLIDQIIDNSEVNFPPVLVDAEAEEDYKALLARLERENTSIQSYLISVNKTQEQLAQELTETAQRRVTISLLLSEIARKENLGITDADLDAAIAAGAAGRNTSPAAYRASLENRNELRTVANQVQTDKILNFLLSSAIVTEKPIDEIQAEGESTAETLAPTEKKPEDEKAAAIVEASADADAEAAEVKKPARKTAAKAKAEE
jgi:trigger factor